MNLLQTCIPVIVTLGILALACYIRTLRHRKALQQKAQLLFNQGVEFSKSADALPVPFKMDDASTVNPTVQVFASKDSLLSQAESAWGNALSIAIEAHAFFLAARLANNLGCLALMAEEILHAKARFTDAHSLVRKASGDGAAALTSKIQSSLQAVELLSLFLKGQQQARLDHEQAKLAARCGTKITSEAYAACSATFGQVLLKATESENGALTSRVLREEAMVHMHLKEFQQAEAAVHASMKIRIASGLNPLPDLQLLDDIQEQDLQNLLGEIHEECFRESAARNEEIRRSCTGLMLHANRLVQDGDHARAVEQARKAVKLSEPLGPLHITVAESLRTLGQALVSYGDIEEAKTVLLRARFAASEHPTQTALLAQIAQSLSYCAGA